MECRTYHEIRGLIKTGDLIEFGSASLLGKAIRFFTKQEVNHSALALSIDQYSAYVGNRKFVLEANPPGIELHTAGKDVADCLADDGTVYWYPLLPKFDNQRNAIADFALQLVGTKYDYGSLFKNAISRVNADMRKLFCSEFVFLSLVAGKVIPGLYFDADGKVVDSGNKPVKAPRPGEFKQYGVHGPAIRLLK